MTRIGCILVANFPLAALLRADPALTGVPLVISASHAAHAETLFVSEAALRQGVRAGMKLAQARMMTASLVARPRSAAAAQAAAAAIADAAEAVSPLVEPGGPGEDGCVWLDLSGLGRLYESEEAIASELVRRVQRVGMEAAVGIAANHEIAHLAACCGGIRIIPPGHSCDSAGHGDGGAVRERKCHSSCAARAWAGA